MQADQNLRSLHEEILHPRLSIMCQENVLIRLCVCAGVSESSLGAHDPQIRFLMLRLRCIVNCHYENKPIQIH